MVVFLLYFPKFILSVRTFFYIYCPSQYEKVATWIWGWISVFRLYLCANEKQTKSKALEWVPREISCFSVLFSLHHISAETFFLRLELKTSRNYFWPTQRTAEEQHVLLHPLRRSASIPLENFTNHLSLPHSSKSHFFFAFIFYSFTLCLSLQT